MANKNAAQCVERLLRGSCNAALGSLANGFCGWLLHCKRFLSVFAVIFVSTVVCPACLCFGIASTGPNEFR
ncbi:hypothetical protein ACFP4H_22610, partial [Pseudophaeobacter arcticus]|uniref:hypothetical protein n=1 Tax=Pseudophaeobacter arcticus TaxID=385492 RepID=UPI003610B6B5